MEQKGHVRIGRELPVFIYRVIFFSFLKQFADWANFNIFFTFTSFLHYHDEIQRCKSMEHFSIISTYACLCAFLSLFDLSGDKKPSYITKLFTNFAFISWICCLWAHFFYRKCLSLSEKNSFNLRKCSIRLECQPINKLQKNILLCFEP